MHNEIVWNIEHCLVVHHYLTAVPAARQALNQLLPG